MNNYMKYLIKITKCDNMCDIKYLDRIIKIIKIFFEHDIITNVTLEYSFVYFIIFYKKSMINFNFLYHFFVGILLISSKFHMDEHYNNSTFSKISGIELKILNKVEIYILNKLNYKLHIAYQKVNKIISKLNI